MVRVRDSHPIQIDNEIDTTAWLNTLAARYQWDESRVSTLQQTVDSVATLPATDWGTASSQALKIGLEMTEILAALNLDTPGLQAALLYRAVRENKIPLAQVAQQFGEVVGTLVDGVLQMAIIGELRSDSVRPVLGVDSEEQAAKVREMLISIIADVRVALIKLAERTCAIRAVKTGSKERKLRVAREVFDVYAPLAHRLGIGHLKWELEDLAFRYLEPEEYLQIARLLGDKRLEREHFVDEVIGILTTSLKQMNKPADISGRAKHIYSIWKKMHRKNVGFSQIYDLRAVRILVDSVSDCYAVLGIVHSLWRNIPNEFDDYIASPKENGYRSLHTAVIGPSQRVIEIQIRTHEMHAESEYGVCSHWEYKDTDRNATVDYENRISWLRQILDWHEELGGVEVENYMRVDSAPERIYVFTRDGHVVDLPPEATPLDFAYRVHTEIGHRCRGARVNDTIHPLNKALNTGDRVEILTAKQASPSRAWMQESLGYLKTARARAKVRQWFREEQQDANITSGKALLEKELRHVGLDQVNIDELAGQFNRANAEGLYEALGLADIRPEQVIRRAQAMRSGHATPIRKAKRKSAERYADSKFYIYGVGDLLTRVAQCCKPQPGDDICGYLTTGRGVTIHRTDCGKVLRLQVSEPKRLLQVSWGGSPERAYVTSLEINAHDRAGLLKDITTIIHEAGIFVLSLNTNDTSDGMVSIAVGTEVESLEMLSLLINQLEQLPNVTDVQRVS
ncbi:MAG: bifunctional (p)ppGpp synthetase/guanosine-3',5'-bis(diphosphate) 3'-pyrophosphohydrolase [Porticoccaceae bacterium]|nr:bifunctional (p)ppGpp synthetase/guanosine-3',5'-bis(diphosphate) 3'-pyrophosphohydrolase [Porticoccaceae bacterium]